jgi:hypothetical protein
MLFFFRMQCVLLKNVSDRSGGWEGREVSGVVGRGGRGGEVGRWEGWGSGEWGLGNGMSGKRGWVGKGKAVRVEMSTKSWEIMVIDPRIY